MQKTTEALMPRTTTDIVFDTLQDEILTLKLLPGTRISEAEVANRLGVSRQPVRDAFNRLGNLGFLLIRPQRATEVRGFSMPEIENARFIRLTVELEVIERACAAWDQDCATALDAIIAAQEETAAAGQTERFHALDYAFHSHICKCAGQPLAFETIERCKRAIDRLCVLSLGKAHEVTGILREHKLIAAALAAGAASEAREVLRQHLTRLDDTIAEIHAEHSEYFE